MPLHKQPYWKNTYKLKPEDFLVAETAYSAMLSIPLYTKMTDDDQSRVIEALTHILC
jgi:dTDP-4-amino-4,6-dideoxygalactose transaminase